MNISHSGDPRMYVARLNEWIQTIGGPFDGYEVSSCSYPRDGLSSDIVIFETRRADRQGPSNRYAAHLQSTEAPTFPRLNDVYASSVELQFHVLAAVAKAGVTRVPRVVALEQGTQYFGRPFFVDEFVDGVTLPSVRPMAEGYIARDLNTDQRASLYTNALAQLASIHAIDWRGYGLEFLGDVDISAGRTMHHLQVYGREIVQRLEGREHPLLTATTQWLVENVPTERDVGLIWGDARLGNVLVSPSQTVEAILDWEAAAILPTDADLGWWIFVDWVNHENDDIPRLSGVPERDVQISIYEKFAHRTVHDLLYWQVIAAWKIALAYLRIGDRMVRRGLIAESECDFVRDNAGTKFIKQFTGL
jgi:aminoglycoside phosphotransferase (APT) family kinase protein